MLDNATLITIRSKALPDSCDKEKIAALAMTLSLFWTRYKVGRGHEDFGKMLRDTVMSWNSRKV